MKIRHLLLAGLIIAAVSCSNGQAQTATTAEPATVGSTSTTSSSTSSTISPPTTPTAVESTSTILTTIPGDADWRAIVETLGQRRQDLYASPDVAGIPNVCGDQSQCADQLNVQIADLATKGWKVVGADPFVVIDARVEKFDGATIDDSLLVTVVAVIQRPANAGTIVDKSGAEVAGVEAGTSVGYNAQGRFLLGRVGPPDDPWRLVSQDKLPEVAA